MAFVGMAQPSVPPAKSRRPVPALAAYLSNPGVLCVLADLSQAVLSVEPVRAIARNSLAGSRRWNAPRDAPHSRVLERFANFASLFRCDAALREIVHDLIDVPLDGAGRVWLFLVGHRASSSPSSVDSSHPAPAVRSSTRSSGLPLRLWEIFRAISSKKPARSGLRANAAPCKHQLPSACAIMR